MLIFITLQHQIQKASLFCPGREKKKGWSGYKLDMSIFLAGESVVCSLPITPISVWKY